MSEKKSGKYLLGIHFLRQNEEFCCWNRDEKIIHLGIVNQKRKHINEILKECRRINKVSHWFLGLETSDNLLSHGQMTD